MGSMDRKSVRKAEESRQRKDRSRALHAQAYRFILTIYQQTKAIPTTEQLAEWLKEMGKRPDVGALILSMCKYGWLAPHGAGYRLKTQIEPESILNAISEAHANKQPSVVRELLALHQANQGAATAKAGRRRNMAGSGRQIDHIHHRRPSGPREGDKGTRGGE